ncbi:NAD(P)-dependent oxidoreductase [Aliikangiella maris]|uniref:NAD(P)-dependent oxidoreductase n=2 Tax=Aliikangiella maris TaxID=3162458 RepID=A0ABV3MQZ8_9GAMM
MNITFTEISEDWQVTLIKHSLADHQVKIFAQTAQEIDIEALAETEILCPFIYSACDQTLLQKLPRLKAIATNSTGFDHIDLAYCKANQLSVFNVPHYGEHTVAEFTFALLLAISRKIIDSVNRVKSGSFDFTGLRGFDLANKTMGIIGFGNIGQKFAKMCKGFDMQVNVYDIAAHQLHQEADSMGVNWVSLEQIFTASDIISLHLPLTSETKHIIDHAAIQKMQAGVILLNTSRGDLIDSTALLAGLHSKKVAFAGLDVLEGESLIKGEIELLHEQTKRASELQILLEDHVLIQDKRVFVTPHNAFNTQDALARILTTTVSNIDNFVSQIKSDNQII